MVVLVVLEVHIIPVVEEVIESDGEEYDVYDYENVVNDHHDDEDHDVM